MSDRNFGLPQEEYVPSMSDDPGLGTQFRPFHDPSHCSAFKVLRDFYSKPHPVLDVLDPWDTQIGGEHYKLPIQPLQYALANNLGIMEHAVVKYVTRHPSKGGKQDLEKARDYIDKMIAHYYS